MRHPAPQGTVPIAPKAMACGWSPGALSGSRGDRTVPHLLTANSNERKPTGAWVLAGVVRLFLDIGAHMGSSRAAIHLL